jgi:uncharacterized damage-inducible protein DinB
VDFVVGDVDGGSRIGAGGGRREESIPMKKTIALLMGAAALMCAADPVGQVYDSQLKGAEGEFVPLAEAMPAGKFDFKPTQGDFAKVRTYTEQVKHVATVNYMIGAAVLGEKAPRDLGKGENGPDDVKGKDAVIQYLKESFAYLHSAMNSVTAKNQTEMIAAPWGNQKMARGALAMIGVSHPFDHYGQMVVYARMNGIVPPASK